MRNLSWDKCFRRNMVIDFRPSPLRFIPSFFNFCQSTDDSPSWPRLHGQGVILPLFTFDGLNARQVNKEDWFCLDSKIWYKVELGAKFQSQPKKGVTQSLRCLASADTLLYFFSACCTSSWVEKQLLDRKLM